MAGKSGKDRRYGTGLTAISGRREKRRPVPTAAKDPCDDFDLNHPGLRAHDADRQRWHGDDRATRSGGRRL